jgi:gamma-glutamyltranspeptidase
MPNMASWRGTAVRPGDQAGARRLRHHPAPLSCLADNPEIAGLDPAGRALFYGADGQPLPVGTVVRNPALADTLEALASKGADWFYSGANAQAIATKVGTAPINPAPMTTADLAAFKRRAAPAVCGRYRQYRICSMGPPSSGATTVLATLGQLERFDLSALGPDSPVAWHLLAESERLAYADRDQYLADPDFVQVPVAGLVDPAYLAQRSRSCPRRPAARHRRGARRDHRAGPGPAQPEHGTSHFVVVDRWGNAASYTSTVESAFGSGLMANGYFLNNELTDFNLDPMRDGQLTANRVEGGKRPRSSMSPTVVYGPDGQIRLVVGAAGGATIPAQVIRALIGVLDWHLTAQQALALPVLFAPGDRVCVEQGSRLETMIPTLIAMGHTQTQACKMPLKANAIERVGTGAGVHGRARPIRAAKAPPLPSKGVAIARRAHGRALSDGTAQNHACRSGTPGLAIRFGNSRPASSRRAGENACPCLTPVAALAEMPNLVSLFLARAAEQGEAPFLSAKRDGRLGGAILARRGRSGLPAGTGAARMGLNPGDRVMLVSENRPEWCIADIAIMAAGLVTVPTYTTNTARDHLHILENSGARAIIVSNAKLAQPLLAAALTASCAEHVIGMEPLRQQQAGTLHFHDWDALVQGDAGAALRVAERLRTIRREDLACIIYTSGTGGRRAGCASTMARSWPMWPARRQSWRRISIWGTTSSSRSCRCPTPMNTPAGNGCRSAWARASPMLKAWKSWPAISRKCAPRSWSWCRACSKCCARGSSSRSRSRAAWPTG